VRGAERRQIVPRIDLRDVKWPGNSTSLRVFCQPFWQVRIRKKESRMVHARYSPANLRHYCTLAIALALSLLPVTFACSRSAPPPVPASGGKPTATSMAAASEPPPYEYAGLQFVTPTGWSVEQVQGFVLILSPTVEANWQANISVEARSDPEARSLDAAVDSIAGQLRVRKAGFQELGRVVKTHPSGFQFARIEYTCREAGGTALTEWEVIIQAHGDARYFVLCSASTVLLDKYAPIFENFFKSIRLAEG